MLLNGGLMLCIAWLLSACQPETKAVALTGKTMGTTYHIKYIENGDQKVSSAEAHKQIDLILQDVNNKMSTYIPTSELSLFNQLREVNTPVDISADLGEVIAEAIRLNKVTEGALDITVGPIVNLWGFGPEHHADKEPSTKEISERQNWVGIDKISLIEQEGRFRLQKHMPQVYIDLSSIAKGFGVDQVANYLDSIHIQNYMVEIGGEIRAKGKNAENQPWQIAIEQPTFDGRQVVQQIIGLTDGAMATSGDYRNYFEQNGKRYSHEIDPATGYPIQHKLASITVFAPTSMTADGLSTGLFVLGEEKALEIAEREKLAVFLIVKEEKGYRTVVSSELKKILEQQ